MHRKELPVLPNQRTTAQWKPLQGRMGENITTKHACRAAVLRQAVLPKMSLLGNKQPSLKTKVFLLLY